VSAEKKDVQEMIADMLREIGILLLVFGAIDGLEHHTELARHGLTPRLFAAELIGASAIIIGLGMVLEAVRKEPGERE
jgi:hypothetical protein